MIGPVASRLYLQRRWINDIPLKFLWTVKFTPRSQSINMSRIGDNITKILQKYEKVDNTEWPVDISKIDAQTDRTFGYLFASNISFPSDSFTIIDAPVPGIGGIIPGYVGSSRTGYAASNKLDITFLETNIDVLDYFIRPWIIAVSHKGLIEQGLDDPDDLKCNIYVNLYTRDKESYDEYNSPTMVVRDRNKPATFQLRKSFMFEDVVPFNIGGDKISYGELSYAELSKIVSFAFSRYTTVKQASIAGLE